jgi:hypothetical protein
MSLTSIHLGSQDRVGALYSYPNDPNRGESLATTVLHWFNQTLERDGFRAQGARAAVRVVGADYYLDLDGPAAVGTELARYAARLPRFLENGWNAFSGQTRSSRKSASIKGKRRGSAKRLGGTGRRR